MKRVVESSTNKSKILHAGQPITQVYASDTIEVINPVDVTK